MRIKVCKLNHKLPTRQITT